MIVSVENQVCSNLLQVKRMVGGEKADFTPCLYLFNVSPHEHVGCSEQLGKLGTGDYIGVKHTLIRLTVLQSFFGESSDMGISMDFLKWGYPQINNFNN